MIEPYYSDGAVTIYHGDCREILPLLDARAFAGLLMDPPYGIDYRSNWPGTLPRSIAGDTDTILRDSILEWWGDGPAFVFGSWKITRPAGTRAQLIYDKGGATGMGDLSIPFKPSHEEIYVLGGGFAGSRDCGSVLQGRVQAMASHGREHPHEKDHRTLRQMLAKLPDGAVLDPCMGIGPTLRAAKDLHRRAVGIELDERYCEVAVRLLGQSVIDFGEGSMISPHRRITPTPSPTDPQGEAQ